MTFRIELKKVSFSYEGARKLFSDLDVELRDGEVTVVVSGVGGGKSTFLKLCAGLLQPTQGRIVIDGKIFWNLTELEKNDIRKKMGFDFQEGALIANMSIARNLAVSILYHGRASEQRVSKTVDDWLEKLGISEYKDALPAALSTGLKRRVSYIRLMMTEGNYFFWDEPTEGTDEEQSELIIETVLTKKKEGRGSLIATQDASLLRMVADRIIILKDGKVAYDGPLASGRIPVEIETSGMIRG